jgi:tetratricopeptide (TPR) repeat protein
LQVDKPVVISAVSGMGGIGKSELALQYAFEHLTTTYPGGICWLKARGDLGLQIVEFARIHSNLEPPTDWELVEKVRWCWQRWRDAATLIIFDDVQGYGDIQPFFPPPQSQFRVLLTSRSKFPAPVQDCEIKVLSEARSIELLGSFSDDVKSRIAADLATALKICHWLGYLPLGLELVGRYLANDEDLSVAEVWQYLNNEKLMAQALLTAEAGMTGELGVIAAFELSWQKLSPEAQELAARLSLFALAEMPWSLVEQCLSACEPQQLKDLRQSLLRSSLLTRTRQGMYELHQLLREFFALKLVAMPQWVEFTTEFAQVLTAVAKTIPQTVTIEQQTNLLELIPHIAAATEFHQYLDSVDKLWCCGGLGRFYATQSQFLIAESWHQKALNISEQHLGIDHQCTSASLNNLAGLYESMGKYTKAEPMYLRSIGILEQQLETNHLDISQSLNNLAALYVSMGRYIEAEPLHVRALALREWQLGTENTLTAQSLNNLAALYTSMGKHAEAEPLYEQSLSIREQQLGKNHPSTAASLSNLAALYASMSRYAEAEPLYKRSLSIREQQLGKNHPSTANSLNNLAALYCDMGRPADAETLYVTTLEILENTLGTDHPNTQTCQNNLQILRQQLEPPSSNG